MSAPLRIAPGALGAAQRGGGRTACPRPSQRALAFHLCLPLLGVGVYRASHAAEGQALSSQQLHDPFADTAAPAKAASRAPAVVDSRGAAAASIDELLRGGLVQLAAGKHQAARELLTRAQARYDAAPQADLRSPLRGELLLALGIACYRQGALPQAERALQEALRSRDAEVVGAARVFLALCHRARGATAEARRELLAARRELQRSAAPGRGAGALRGDESDLLTLSAEDSDPLAAPPPRLRLSLGLALEIDGNVPLTDLTTWRSASSESSDGALVLTGSAALRPLRRLDLALQGELAYRQQLRPNPSDSASVRFQDYNLLFTRLGAVYNHATERNRLRVQGGASYANLGGSSLFWEIGARAADRLRVVSLLGVGLSYDGRYRHYLPTDLNAFTGHTHTLQAELSYGTAPTPVSAALSYQVIREELRAPQRAADAPYNDFRAFAHGPLLRLRAQLHRRVELLFLSALVRRSFDEPFVTLPSDRRADWWLSADATAYLDCARFVEAYLGAGVIYNHSNVEVYTFVKPQAFAGALFTFSGL